MELELRTQLKILRDKYGDSLRTMARKLGITASYLSAIETGKRNIPDNFELLLFDAYSLSEEEKGLIKQALYSCKKNYIINLAKVSNNERLILKYLLENDPTEEQLDKMLNIIKNQ